MRVASRTAWRRRSPAGPAEPAPRVLADLEQVTVVVVPCPARAVHGLLEVADRVDRAGYDRVGALPQPRLQAIAPPRGALRLHVGLLPATRGRAEAALRPQPLTLLAHAPADRE